jgi:hypothetical protein
MRSPSELGIVVAGFCLGSIAAAAAAPAASPAPPLARLTYVLPRVEQGVSGAWHDARENGGLQIGEQLRTAVDAVLRVDFSWMSMTVSSASLLRFPDEHLLEAILDRGRVALLAEHREILKLRTEEAEVRGQGHVVVRRLDRGTLVSSLGGGFFVESAGSVMSLPAGTGTIVRAGKPPTTAASLPPPPESLFPGDDPVLVGTGQAIRLRWKGHAASYHVDVLAVGSDTVLLERDVTEPAMELVIPWPGAFRWRVASRDADGLEGRPSSYGFICVD